MRSANTPTYAYDVFVSFSHEDERWVVKTLLPHLTQRNLRVCIDSRFVAGDTARHPTCEAVKRSRRTLLVLTPR
jgi:hypothetical protein